MEIKKILGKAIYPTALISALSGTYFGSDSIKNMIDLDNRVQLNKTTTDNNPLESMVSQIAINTAEAVSINADVDVDNDSPVIDQPVINVVDTVEEAEPISVPEPASIPEPISVPEEPSESIAPRLPVLSFAPEIGSITGQSPVTHAFENVTNARIHSGSIEPSSIEDFWITSSLQQGTTGDFNLRALPNDQAFPFLLLSPSETALGSCQASIEQREYFDIILNNPITARYATETLQTLSTVAFPIAETESDIVEGSQSEFKTLQEMLVRANCFDTIAAHNDGANGPNTQKAIYNFYQTHKGNYPELVDSLVLREVTESTDEVASDNITDRIIGVTPAYIQVLTQMATQQLAYTESVIRDLNTDEDGRFNKHSYDIAMSQEINGEFIGQEDPNYTPFRVSAEDIDALARTGFGESRGEGREGRIAAMYSIVNRTIMRLNDDSVSHYFYKQTVEETAKAKNRNRNGVLVAQYSAWNEYDNNYRIIQNLRVDGRTENDRIFREFLDLAEDIMYGEIEDPINGITHYHTHAVHPRWSRGRTPDQIIEGHRFFSLHDDVTLMRANLSKLADTMAEIQAVGQTAQVIFEATQNTNRFGANIRPQTNPYGIPVFRMTPN